MSEEQNIESTDSENSSTPQSSVAGISTQDAIKAVQADLAAKEAPPTKEEINKVGAIDPTDTPAAKVTKKLATQKSSNSIPPQSVPDETDSKLLDPIKEDLSKEAISDVEKADNKPLIPTPKFLDAEKRAKFEKLPYEAKEIVASFEHQTRKWGSQIANEVAEVRKFHQALEGVISPHAEMLKLNRTEPLQAIDHLLTNAAMMDRDPIYMIGRFMQQYGLSPQHFMNGHQNGNGYQPQYDEEEYQDPRAEEALNRVNELKSQLEQQSQATEAQKRAALKNEIEIFTSETDTEGNLLRPHFEFYRPQIAQIAERLEEDKPWLSPQQVLNEAYTSVVGEIEEKFVKPRLANGQFTAQKVEQSKKAAIAASSLSGSSLGNSVKRKYSSTSDARREAARELGMDIAS